MPDCILVKFFQLFDHLAGVAILQNALFAGIMDTYICFADFSQIITVPLAVWEVSGSIRQTKLRHVKDVKMESTPTM